MEEYINNVTKEQRKNIKKQRKKAVKEVKNYHKNSEKVKNNDDNTSANENNILKENTNTKSKIERKLNEEVVNKRDDLTQEEIYINKSNKKIENLQPKAHDDGFYVDEYGERQKQKKIAKEIHDQENEKVKKLKKPLTNEQLKRKTVLLSCISLAIIVAICVTLSLTVLFKTKHIVVEGDEYYSQEELISDCNVFLNQNLFIAKMTATTDKLIKKYPYIEDVELSVSIPDTIKIEIINAVPSYVIKYDNKYLIISAKGMILDASEENKINLPILTRNDLTTTKIGEKVSFTNSDVTDILVQISESLNKNGYNDKISVIDVTNTATLKLVYDYRIGINLGLPEDLDYKIRTAMNIINTKLDPNNIGVICGTVDVSTCNVNRISRYDPKETVMVETAPPMQSTEMGNTQPSTAKNTKGVNSVVAFDTDGDGKVDCFDTNGDGLADVYGSTCDQVDNSKILVIGYDANKDGIIDCFDTDGDGTADFFGSFYAVPTSTEPVAEPETEPEETEETTEYVDDSSVNDNSDLTFDSFANKNTEPTEAVETTDDSGYVSDYNYYGVYE